MGYLLLVRKSDHFCGFPTGLLRNIFRDGYTYVPVPYVVDQWTWEVLKSIIGKIHGRGLPKLDFLKGPKKWFNQFFLFFSS